MAGSDAALAEPSPATLADFYLIFRPWSGVMVSWWLRWAGRFLEPGFGHVGLLWRHPGLGGGWVLVEWLPTGLAVLPMSGALSLSDMMSICPAGRCVRLRRPTALPLRTRRPAVLSCVSITKAILGVDWRRVWTPYGIYRRALADGGVEIEWSSHERQPLQEAEGA